MIRVILIVELVFACIAVFAVAAIGFQVVLGMGSLSGYYGDGDRNQLTSVATQISDRRNASMTGASLEAPSIKRARASGK